MEPQEKTIQEKNAQSRARLRELSAKATTIQDKRAFLRALSAKATTIQDKRAFLRALSAKATALREKMLHKCKNDQDIQAVNGLTINRILVDFFYKDDQNKTFKSFKGWIKEGKAVRKGEKAYLVWGKPNEKKEDGTVKPIMEDEEGNTFFPISFIFSNAQVQEIEKKATT